MKEFFKRDNFWLGVGISAVLTFAVYFLIQLITILIAGDKGDIFRNSTDQLLAICVNLLPFRYYIVRLKADKTAKGIMLITFVLALAYFYMNWPA